MTTFSQLVDDMVLETKRPDMRAEIASYLNQTIRECMMDPETNAAVLLRENYREVAVQATSDLGFRWDVPRLDLLQAIDKVRFASVWVDNQNPYAESVTPGPKMTAACHAYQYGGGSLIFKGYGGLNAWIQISYYEFPRHLKYFAPSQTPAVWDDDAGWTYGADVILGDPDSELAARERSTNWLLMRWKTVVAEGLRAKIYKRLSDDTRARTCYSLYQSLRRGLITSEQAITGAF